MAKAKTETTVTETAAPKKVRKYRAIEGGMEFRMPDGTWKAKSFESFHAKTRNDCMFYGAGQKWQDGLYAKSKTDAPATMEEAEEFFGGYEDGTLFERSRSGGGVSMHGVAVVMYKAAFHAQKGKNPSADELKAGVEKWLGNVESAQYKAVTERFEALRGAPDLEI